VLPKNNGHSDTLGTPNYAGIMKFLKERRVTMTTLAPFYKQSIKMFQNSIELCEELSMFMPRGDMKLYNSKLEELIVNCEKTANRMRGLPFRFGMPGSDQFVADALIEGHDVKIDLVQPKWLRIQMPCLIPRKVSSIKSTFIFEPLFCALEKFKKQHRYGVLRYDSCVLIIRHLFDRNMPPRYIADNDNLDIKLVQDLLKANFFSDDNSVKCVNFFEGIMSDKNSTEIFIIPQEDFDKWWTQSRAK
jgi:hypothetical protein